MARLNPWITTAALIILGVGPVAAHAQDEHAAHHPAAPPAAATPSSMPMGEQKGMMGDDSKMQGMGREGEMPMCGMMNGGPNMARHVEDHLARLRADLEITAAQAAAWNRYAVALRATAGVMEDAHRAMMTKAPGSLPSSPVDQLDQHAKMLTGILDSIRALRPAVVQLYTTLSPAQKQKADAMLLPHGAMMKSMPRGGMERK